MISFNDLPDSFVESMKSQLGDGFDRYVRTLSEKPVSGIRINTGKTDPDTVFRKIQSDYEAIPWMKNGYYVDETVRFTKHPFYYAGLYYIQEPSAMTPVTWLNVQEDDTVLDLCAAPGGKSTQIACSLGEQGTLYSNDPSASRAKALLKNIELSGTGNVMITCAMPQQLETVYPAFFDRILCDAPCSGEGMFRKERAVLNAYLEHGPAYFAPIQKSVLESAAVMLKPGGVLVYSTCTFSRTEDEDNIEWFLQTHPDFELVRMKKLYPHEIRGEGHFVAELHKKERDAGSVLDRGPRHPHSPGRGKPRLPQEFTEFLENIEYRFDPDRFFTKDKYIYYLPAAGEIHGEIHYIRTGLLMGRMETKRFEPSQALAMWLQGKWKNELSFDADDPRIMKYLKGETIEAEDEADGYRLLCADGYPLGFVKQSGHRCKNKYYPGWRYN